MIKDKLSKFIEDNNLIYLSEESKPWLGYIGTQVTYEGNKIFYRHFTNKMQEFAYAIIEFDFFNSIIDDFKKYLERRIKIYKLFHKDSKAEISKIVAIYNMRANSNEKIPFNWW